jgi:hypothetical protein
LPHTGFAIASLLPQLGGKYPIDALRYAGSAYGGIECTMGAMDEFKLVLRKP